MTNTIAHLWYGNLDPIRVLGKNNSEMKKLEIFIHRHFEKLEEHLDEKEKELLKKYEECVQEYLLVNGEQAFCDGFSLGAKIAFEALAWAEQLL